MQGPSFRRTHQYGEGLSDQLADQSAETTDGADQLDACFCTCERCGPDGKHDCGRIVCYPYEDEPARK